MWTKIVAFLGLMTANFCYAVFEMKNISFVQEDEVSKIVFEFDKNGVRASRFKNDKDKQVILDIGDTRATSRVMRAFDASEFDGAIVFVSPYQKPGSPGDIRVAIQLRDNVRSVLESIDNKLILSVENRFGIFSDEQVRGEEAVTKTGQSATTSKFSSLERLHIPKSDSVEDILENLTQSGKKKYIGKKIHFDVKNIEVGDLLKMIADASGFNIIVDQSVNAAAPITLSLVNIPWDQALDTIMGISKLVANKNGNILIITTLQKATAEKKLALEAEKLLEVEEPMVTKIFPISYASSSDLIKTLSEYGTKDRGKISFDNRTNQLIVKDTVDAVERIRRMIEVLDTQTPQVLIEAKVVEAEETFARRIGLSAGVGGTYTFSGTPGGGGSNSGSFSFSSAPGGENPTALGATISVFRRLSDIEFSLQLMEQHSMGKIISTPKVITQNKQTASIVNNKTTGYTTTVIDKDGNPSAQVQSVSSPLSLSVTPQVTNEGSIIMQVAVQKSSATITDKNVPNSTQNTISTNVLVDNGSTVVIGGIYSLEENESHSGIPLLKDIPILGWLFRSAHNPSRTKQELIIFLTPRIINEQESGDQRWRI